MMLEVSKRLVTLDRALSNKQLLGLGDESWLTWRSVLKAAYAEPLDAAERAAFDQVAGGRQPPGRKVKELVVVASRRCGKGRAAGGLATYEGALVDHTAHLAPGEVGVVACISPTRAQAKIVQDYALGFLSSSKVLADEIGEVTADEIRLHNGNVIATLSSDYRTLRGRTLLLAILDEASFLRDETSSTPDIEAARALLPGLSTTRGMLVILSSPYRRAGLLYQRHRDHFAKDSDVLVVAGPSLLFNPTLDAAEIDAARASDPEGAISEWFGEFRSDLSTFLSHELIDASVDHDRPIELPPQPGVIYRAFVDPNGGGSGENADAYTLAIGHAENGRIVIDLVRGISGRLNPHAVTHEFASLCRSYRVTAVKGDSYAKEWVATTWRETGIAYENNVLPKSEIYLEIIPSFTRGLVRLPPQPTLLRELRLLERQVHRSGKDSVNHPRGGHDDYANAACGVMYLLNGPAPFVVTPELLARALAMRPTRPLHTNRRRFTAPGLEGWPLPH